MAFSSEFFDSYNSEKTNIRKRRKENAEMFEAYKDGKVADGEEVNVEELANMRNNLAGGDFYFGQALPAESMMSELTDRTNKRVRNTISSEFAEQAVNVEKITKVVDDMMPQLVSIDDYEGSGGQEKIKSIFAAVNPADPEFGTNLFDAWKDRLPKKIEAARANEVNNFMLQNKDANLFSEVKHLTVGLPSWKQSSIEQAFLSKEKVFDNSNFNLALKNVNSNVKPAEFTQMTDIEFTNFAQQYLLRTGVLAKDITPERLAAAKAALDPIYNAEKRRYSTQQDSLFDAAVRSDVSLMGIMSDPAYDNKQIIFDTINRHRLDAGLAEYGSKEDADFLKLVKSFSGTALNLAIAKYSTKETAANKSAEVTRTAALALTEKNFSIAYAGLKDTDNNKIKESVAKLLHSNYHIMPSHVQKIFDLISEHVEDDPPDTQAEVNALMQLVSQRFGLPTTAESILFYQKAAKKTANLGMKPNSTVQEMVEANIKPLKIQIKQTLAIIALTARDSDLTRSGYTIDFIKEKAVTEVNAYYKKLLEQITLDGNILDNDDSAAGIMESLKKEQQASIEEIYNAKPNGKPSYLIKLRPGVFIVAPGSAMQLPPGVSSGSQYSYDSVENKYVLIQGSNSGVTLNSVGHPKNNRAANGQILIMSKTNTVPKRQGNSSEVQRWNNTYGKFYWANGTPKSQMQINADVAHGRLP